MYFKKHRTSKNIIQTLAQDNGKDSAYYNKSHNIAKHHVSITVDGLVAPNFFAVQLNNQSIIDIKNNGTFTFPESLPNDTTYNIKIVYVSGNQSLKITNHSGIITNQNINVTITAQEPVVTPNKPPVVTPNKPPVVTPNKPPVVTPNKPNKPLVIKPPATIPPSVPPVVIPSVPPGTLTLKTAGTYNGISSGVGLVTTNSKTISINSQNSRLVKGTITFTGKFTILTNTVQNSNITQNTSGLPIKGTVQFVGIGISKIGQTGANTKTQTSTGLGTLTVTGKNSNNNPVSVKQTGILTLNGTINNTNPNNILLNGSISISPNTSGNGNIINGVSLVTATGGKLAYPIDNVIYDAANNILYGTASGGLSTNSIYGGIYSYNLNTNLYNTLYTFGTVSNDGGVPYAAPILINNVLYGTVKKGSSGINYGVIYAYDLIKSTYTVLYQFTSRGSNSPVASLIYYNNLLYGTNTKGGHGVGTVFSFTPSTDPKLINYSEFNIYISPLEATNNEGPHAPLVEYNGLLYGTTFGTNAIKGMLFSFNPTTNAFTIIDNVAGPISNLLVINNILYGVSRYDGINTSGSIYSYDPSNASNKIVSVYSLPDAKLGTFNSNISYINDLIYGAMASDVINGSLFTYDISTATFKTIYTFKGLASTPDGSNPRSTVIDVNGILYGTTKLGGINGNVDGTIYSYDPNQTIVSTQDNILVSF